MATIESKLRVEPKPAPLSREDQAKLEIGNTEIRPATKWFLVFFFIAIIFTVPVIQMSLPDPASEDYKLRVADEISITAVPELNPKRQEIDSDGTVSFEGTGKVQVAGLTRAEAAGVLKQKGFEQTDVRVISNVKPLQPLEIFKGATYGPTVAAWNKADGGFVSRLMRANAELLRTITEYDNEQKNSSFLRENLLPPAQLLLAHLGAGNEQAYIGHDGWLFFRPAVDLLTGSPFLDKDVLRRRAATGNEWKAAPQPDPRLAIIDFHKQLKDRGIELVLMPMPVKATIHPEKLTRSSSAKQVLALNPSYEQFVSEMKQAGVVVYDPSKSLLEAKLAGATDGNPAPQFLATDTHWRPEAMDMVAAELAEFINANFNLPETSTQYVRTPVQVTNLGDIAGMLELPNHQSLFEPETVPVHEVRRADGELWSTSADADVLLLGDSFSNIFSLEAMEWGKSAGLAEQLSYHLKRPLDAIRINDSGAFATRDALAKELGRGRDRLKNKRVVVWQFAARELAIGDWKMIELRLGEAVSGPRDGKAIVSGRVADASFVPGTGVPYKDHIRMLHLVDLEVSAGVIEEQELIVYVWDMRDYVLTPEAKLQAGDRVTLEVQPWENVESKYGGLNRSDLDDVDFALPLWWGERVSK